MRVPDTQTIVDTHKELHEMRLKINQLKSEKESVLSSVQLAQSMVVDMNKRSSELEEKIGLLVPFLEELKNEVFISIDKGNFLIRETRDVIDSQLKGIQSFNEKLEKANKDLDIVIDRYKTTHQKIVLENTKLETKKQDLDIYRERLEKIIRENNLNIRIL